MRDIKANIKGMNVHLDDLETWKKGVDSQLGHLASVILRASGNLLGKTEENPRAHIAAVTLRSGKETQLKQAAAQPSHVDTPGASDSTAQPSCDSMA